MLQVLENQANDAAIAVGVVGAICSQPLDNGEQALLHARTHLVGRTWGVIRRLTYCFEAIRRGRA